MEMGNTPVSARVKQELYDNAGFSEQVAMLLGNAAYGDLPVTFYIWDDNSEAADNYPLVIVPTGQGQYGRWLYHPKQIMLPSINNAPGRSLVSVANSANGYQISTTRNSFVNYVVTIGVSATIAAQASGTVVLEIASTNSATPGDWTEISRFTNGQSLSLAIALQSVQTIAGNLSAMIPAGYYVRQRTINNNGTPTFTAGVQQEVLL